ncbi:unnamed protein product [Symbiodinium necroappetens]|uniref:Uncharacterized protein n=1 Tax=Symbiodinium necroappetens TaxID=1628268 RepID=A0A812QFI6_9DINO|nr:unnamed protein product [Symbiodinium necroappetens]
MHREIAQFATEVRKHGDRLDFHDAALQDHNKLHEGSLSRIEALEKEVKELRAASRSPTPSRAPPSPGARSLTPQRERNIEEELQMAIGGWEDCRRDEAVEEAKAIFEAAQIPNAWLEIWSPYSRTSHVRVILQFPPNYKTVPQQRAFQTEVLEKLKGRKWTSNVPGNEGRTIWIQRHRSPEDRAKIRAIVSVKEFIDQLTFGGGLRKKHAEIDWRGKLFVGNVNVLGGPHESDTLQDLDLPLADPRGNHTGWFIKAEHFARATGLPAEQLPDLREEVGGLKELALLGWGQDEVRLGSSSYVKPLLTGLAVILRSGGRKVQLLSDLNLDLMSLHANENDERRAIWSEVLEDSDTALGSDHRRALNYSHMHRCGKWRVDLSQVSPHRHAPDQDPSDTGIRLKLSAAGDYHAVRGQEKATREMKSFYKNKYTPPEPTSPSDTADTYLSLAQQAGKSTGQDGVPYELMFSIMQSQVHLATNHLRNQNVMLQSLVLRAQDQIEKTIRGLGARVTALTGAVTTIEQMYEATAGCINDVFQAMDDVMRKENSLFQEHTAVVARAVKDLEETFRSTLASHKQMFESSGFSHVTYFNDILRLENDLHSNLHEHILPALRFIADNLQALSQSEQKRMLAGNVFVLTLRSRLSSRLDNTAGEVIDRFLQMGPEYLKNNLVHGIQYVLQAQPNPDDGSILIRT